MNGLQTEKFMKPSFWEWDWELKDSDASIIGAGFTGLQTAIALKSSNPSLRVHVYDQLVWQRLASTRNAGFACFGSITELMDDASKMEEQACVDLVAARAEGIKGLLELHTPEDIAYQACGGYELIDHAHMSKASLIQEIEKWNALLKDVVGAAVYELKDRIGGGINTEGKYVVYNTGEGLLNPAYLMAALRAKAMTLGVHLMEGLSIEHYARVGDQWHVTTSKGTHTCRQLVLCTNAMAANMPELKHEIDPGRNTIILSQPMADFDWIGAIHMEKGYLYARNLGNRFLIGGGRHWDFEGEKSLEEIAQPMIIERLKMYAEQLLNRSISIDFQWSGFMGLGSTKKPIIRKLDDNLYCGVRLGGMGVALAYAVGRELTELMEKDLN